MEQNKLILFMPRLFRNCIERKGMGNARGEERALITAYVVVSCGLCLFLASLSLSLFMPVCLSVSSSALLPLPFIFLLLHPAPLPLPSSPSPFPFPSSLSTSNNNNQLCRNSEMKICCTAPSLAFILSLTTRLAYSKENITTALPESLKSAFLSWDELA